MKNPIISITRRGFLELVTAGVAGGTVAGAPDWAFAQSRNEVLVIGMDISDTLTYDPAAGSTYTAPMMLEAAYDTLVTMTPGDYINVKPALATAWARTPDGKGWRFTLRDGVKFNSGNLVTAQDVKWSFDRILGKGEQPGQYIANIATVTVVDKSHVDIVLKDPEQPILDILCSPTCAIYESSVLEKHGGVGGPDAAKTDKATAWLNQHSCGTGAYTLTSWQRNISVQLDRNPHCWRGMPAFKRVIILNFSDPATQLLALQRGTIDAAFNLIPEQIAVVKSENAKTIRVDHVDSLDFVYIGLTSNPEFNKALAVREAREAIGRAIDYKGIRDHLLGGSALRAASFLPIGVLGSTTAIADEIGLHEDLPKAKELLVKAGFPDGFSFKLSYGNGLIAGVAYSAIAEKVQSDLARIGIQAELDPMDQVTLRTQFFSGRLTGTMVFWNSPAVDNWLWAAATVQRVAKRLHWDPPKDIVDLVDQATRETDQQKQAKLWVEYQKRMVEQANMIILFQPIYQIAVANRIKEFPLTAAGWQVDLSGVKA